MKLIRFTNLLVIGLTLSVAAIGCKKTPQGVTPLPGARVGGVGDLPPGGQIPGGEPTPGGDTPGAIPANLPGSHNGWVENATMFESDMVHFAYDSASVRAGEKSKVAAVADYLKANGSAAVRVEGNCDERGTDEYNRALGERRALAVREELVGLGIEASRVDTVSYGRDRPIDTGHSDESHAKNRRAAFVLLTPP